MRCSSCSSSSELRLSEVSGRMESSLVCQSVFGPDSDEPRQPAKPFVEKNSMGRKIRSHGFDCQPDGRWFESSPRIAVVLRASLAVTLTPASRFELKVRSAFGTRELLRGSGSCGRCACTPLLPSFCASRAPLVPSLVPSSTPLLTPRHASGLSLSIRSGQCSRGCCDCESSRFPKKRKGTSTRDS